MDPINTQLMLGTPFSMITEHVLADDIIELMLRPDDLSPADLATNSFSFPNSLSHHEGLSELVKR